MKSYTFIPYSIVRFVDKRDQTVHKQAYYAISIYFKTELVVKCIIISNQPDEFHSQFNIFHLYTVVLGKYLRYGA